MTDSVDTDALREIAVREDRESDTFIDDDFADERYWELREVADALITAADEIDALRARAERAEARRGGQPGEMFRLYEDTCVGGYFLARAGEWEQRTLHRVVQDITAPPIWPVSEVEQ